MTALFRKLFPYSKNPLTLPLKVGVMLNICSIAAFIVFIVLAATGNGLPLTAWLFPSLGLCTSLTLIAIGVAGVYLGYAYDEVKRRPIYIVREKINFGETADGKRG